MFGKKIINLQDYPEHNVSLTFSMYSLCSVESKTKYVQLSNTVVNVNYVMPYMNKSLSHD